MADANPRLPRARSGRSSARSRWRPPSILSHGGGDLTGKIDGRVSTAYLWLQVALVEAVEHGVGHEHDQPQNENGIGMMVIAMTGMLAGAEFVKAFVFDLPTVVPEMEDGLGIGH